MFKTDEEVSPQRQRERAERGYSPPSRLLDYFGFAEGEASTPSL
jgi:hypothetical protein